MMDFRFMMSLTSFNQFVSLFLPFGYEGNYKNTLNALLIMVYFTTFMRVVLPLKGVTGCYTYMPIKNICTAYFGCSTGCYHFFIASIVTEVLLGAIIPFCMYMILFYKAYKARKISSQTSVTMHSPSCSSIATVEINANMIEIKTLLTKNQYMTPRSLGMWFQVNKCSSNSHHVHITDAWSLLAALVLPLFSMLHNLSHSPVKLNFLL